MTTMTAGRHADGGEERALRWTSEGSTRVVVATLVVLWLVTAVLMLFLPMGAMASDPCDSAADGLICTARGQALCWQIPWIGGPVLGAFGTAAALTRVRVVRYGAVVVWVAGLIAMVVWVGKIMDSYHPQ